eukprot:COSAG01_NODE_4593_length_4892_cov_3.056541_1_plen_45_part_10
MFMTITGLIGVHVWRAQAQGLPAEDRARGKGGDARLRVVHVRHLR